MTARKVFDSEYYNRFYHNPETRAVDPDSLQLLVNHVFHYLRYLDITVKDVLDAGCGTGHWKSALLSLIPGINYTGIEVSKYACRKYGWKHASITTFTPGRQYDLVICQSVLQYLPSKEAQRALVNIATLCRGAVYLEIVTREDIDSHCDPEYTDSRIYLRKDGWYRKMISQYFRNCGGGVFVPLNSPVMLYSLEEMPTE